MFQRKDIFAVSGRCGHSFNGQGKVGRCSTDVGQPLKDGVKHTFVETETVNRGPLMLHAKRTQELGFLDEQSFFLGGDDHDLMKRSKLKGYVLGYLPVGFYAPLDLSPVKELTKHIDANTKQQEAKYKQYREHGSKAPRNVYFITYANSKYERAKKRIVKEAQNSNWFIRARGFGPGDLSKTDKYSNILSRNRGGGYMPHHQEHTWTTEHIFKYFNISANDRIRTSGQHIATVLILQKGPHLREWLNLINKALEEDALMFTDEYNAEDKYTGFKDNRHDQSVSSVTRKIVGSIVIHDDTYPPNRIEFPIWASRSTS